jgi:hypothetical protein
LLLLLQPEAVSTPAVPRTKTTKSPIFFILCPFRERVAIRPATIAKDANCRKGVFLHLGALGAAERLRFVSKVEPAWATWWSPARRARRRAPGETRARLRRKGQPRLKASGMFASRPSRLSCTCGASWHRPVWLRR